MFSMLCKLLLVFAAILVVTLAFFGLFGSYTPSDDEGYSISVIRSVADGAPLYTQQFDFHGPLPFLAKALIFRALGAPITAQSVRIWVMGVWLLSCMCLSAAIWELTRNALISISAIIVTGAHLFALRVNPGHPEDFVVLFLCLAILIASAQTAWLSDSLRVAMLGSIGGVLTGTKINVGLFYLAGLTLWLLASVSRRMPWKIAAILFTIIATSIPAVLMRSFLWPSWQLLLISTFSILITCAAFFRLPSPSRLSWKHLPIAAGATISTLAAILVFAWLGGSRPGDVFYQAVLGAATHSNMIVKPVFTWICVPAIPIFLFICFICFRQWIGTVPGSTVEPHVPPALLKVIVALIALIFAACMLPQFYMPLVGAACWLIVFPDGRTIIAGRSQSARLFLVSIAVFQMLQVFPIKGAQTNWSTLALSVCCLVLLYDGVLELSLRPAGVPPLMQLSIKLVGFVTASLLTIFAVSLGFSYWRAPSLGYGESNLIRIPMTTKANFDWVVASVSRYCDALVTQPGLDSFLLWSSNAGADLIRRSPILLVDWQITMPEDRQRQAVAKLDHGSKICAVNNQRLSDWWIETLPANTRARLAIQPLVSYIQQLSSVRKAGDYEIRANEAARAAWKDDYVLNGVREVAGTRNALGVPVELLTDEAHPELVFDFESWSAGPLISIQQPDAEQGDQAFATEPLAYISRAGTLVIRAQRGIFVPLPAHVKVTDGQWHELSFRHEQESWRVSLDGVALGHAGEFTTGKNSPRYLQLGPAFIENCPDLGKGWVPFYGKLREVRVRRAGNIDRLAQLGTR